MKKKLTYIILAAAIFATGCDKFLDVNPKGEVFDEDMFSTAEGYEDALYGIYSEIGTEEDMYAGYYLWIPEACSQNVTCLSDYKLGNLSLADWYNNGPTTVRSGVWETSYEAINHVNNIIQYAEEDGPDRFEYSGLYLGEALALRALIHFELIRLFGVPFYATADERATGIPYVKEYSFDITEFSSLEETYANIIADLKEAESYLGQDETLVTAERDNVAGGFETCRTTHLNLYAVQALLARVYWTMGDIDTACEYAEKVIDSGKFSFRPLSAFVQPDNGTLDMNETIFGIYSEKFETANATKYGLSGSSSTAFELASDWLELYQSTSSTERDDYRINSWFDVNDEKLTKLVNDVYYTGGSSSYSGSSIIGVSVLRIPEMYFIVAEANLQSNPQKALEYFNTVIETRGLDPQETTLTYDQLYAERRREFYGEGFTWHEMKKLGSDITTANGTVLDGTLSSTYTLPIPDEEYEARNDVQ